MKLSREKDGTVDRDKLLDISGRSRKPQIQLAKQYGITKYFAPAGGCLLTEPGFTRRMKDLVEQKLLRVEEVPLLKHGRHFRKDKSAKFVIGRDDGDNNNILEHKKEEDMILFLKDENGPCGLIRGDLTQENIELAAALVVSHSKKKEESDVEVEYWTEEGKEQVVKASALPREEIEEMRV